MLRGLTRPNSCLDLISSMEVTQWNVFRLEIKWFSYFPAKFLFCHRDPSKCKKRPTTLEGENGHSMGESWGTYLWMDGCANCSVTMWPLRRLCPELWRRFCRSVSRAFLTNCSQNGGPVSGKRALYRRKHGPSLLVGEDANAIYEYVAIA